MAESQDEYSHLPSEFNEIVDLYNEMIQKANLLRKSKNEENKQATVEEKPSVDQKYKPQLEAVSAEMKKKSSEFSALINQYLSEYQKNNKLETALVFPPKLIGEFRKIIHDVSDKLGLLHESMGSGAMRKLIVSKEIKDPQPKKKIKIDPKDKASIKEVKKLEFPPDEIEMISVLSLNECEIKLKITAPESYDNPIKLYNVYHFSAQEPDPSKTLLKIENSSEFLLDFQNNASLIQKHENFNILKFKLTASNDYGESFLSPSFQVLLKNSLKARAFCAGSCQKNKIPIETLKLPPGTLNHESFIEIPLGLNQTFLIKSYDTTLLLLDSGVMAQWGMSLMEEPDHKNEESINQLFSEPFLPAPQIIVHTLSIGKDFCCLVSCLGEVFSWGYNHFGQLGHDDRTIRAEPVPIKSLKGNIIIDICCGNHHCLALDFEGKTYVWGRNQAIIGQKEILDNYGKVSNYQNMGVHQFKPRVMKEVLGYYKIKKISAGGFHNAVITENSELYLWGDNESNQLGLKDIDTINITIPKQIELFQINKFQILDISCGGLHTLAVCKDINGTINLYSWGDESQGQCGSGEKKILRNPEIIKEFEGKKIQKISAGSFHSLVMIADDALYGFGYNGNGELGVKTEKKKVRKPIKIETVSKGKIVDIQAGFEISCLSII